MGETPGDQQQCLRVFYPPQQCMDVYLIGRNPDARFAGGRNPIGLVGLHPVRADRMEKDIVVLLLTIPVAILAMRLAEKKI